MHQRASSPGFRRVAVIALSLGLVACSPTFDWREARPEGSGAALMFPCRAEHHQRDVRLGADLVPMRLHSCAAGGAVFSLATLDVRDPAQVTPQLAALRTQMAANLGGAPAPQGELRVPGATPNTEAARVRIVGKRPDGSRVVADAAFFVKGLTLYQATILGSDDAPGREAVEAFFGAIRFP